MRLRAKNLLQAWSLVVLPAVLAVWGAWTVFTALKTGVYFGRHDRIITLVDSPVAFRDHLILLALAAFAAGCFSGFAFMAALSTWGEQGRIDRYLAKRRAESCDETVA